MTRAARATKIACDNRKQKSYRVNRPLEDLDFADYLALLSHRIQDMRDKTHALEEQGAKVWMKINATTKLMRFGTKGGDGVLIAVGSG